MTALFIVLLISIVIVTGAVRDGVFAARGLIVAYMMMIALFQPYAVKVDSLRFLYANVWFSGVICTLVWISLNRGYRFALKTIQMVTVYMVFTVTSVYVLSHGDQLPTFFDSSISKLGTDNPPAVAYAIWAAYVLSAGAAAGIVELTRGLNRYATYAAAIVAGQIVFSTVLTLASFIDIPIRLHLILSAFAFKILISVPYVAFIEWFGQDRDSSPLPGAPRVRDAPSGRYPARPS